MVRFTEKDIRQINRFINRIMKGESPKQIFGGHQKTQRQKAVEKAARTGARRIEEFKKISGKKRVGKEERTALLSYPASSVAKGIKMSEKSLIKRLDKYEDRFGEANLDIINDLRYGTPSMVARKHGTYVEQEKKKKEQKPSEDGRWLVFSKPRDVWIDWYSLPSQIRYLDHHSGNFLYNNAAFFWGNGIYFPRDLVYLHDGDDITVEEFAKLLMAYSYSASSRIEMVEEDGVYAFFDKEEFQSAKELHPDYFINRKYRVDE